MECPKFCPDGVTLLSLGQILPKLYVLQVPLATGGEAQLILIYSWVEGAEVPCTHPQKTVVVTWGDDEGHSWGTLPPLVSPSHHVNSGRFPASFFHKTDIWENLDWIVKNLFGWAFILQNANTSASDLCSPNSQVEKGRNYICVLGLFYALGWVLCDGLFLSSGSHTSGDAVVCVDCVQKSNAMKHVCPTSHFQDTFSLPHVNKYSESKFSFSEQKNVCFSKHFES